MKTQVNLAVKRLKILYTHRDPITELQRKTVYYVNLKPGLIFRNIVLITHQVGDLINS
jgi:hypothetical protein